MDEVLEVWGWVCGCEGESVRGLIRVGYEVSYA
jgi:hypothetical protein